MIYNNNPEDYNLITDNSYTNKYYNPVKKKCYQKKMFKILLSIFLIACIIIGVASFKLNNDKIINDNNKNENRNNFVEGIWDNHTIQQALHENNTDPLVISTKNIFISKKNKVSQEPVSLDIENVKEFILKQMKDFQIENKMISNKIKLSLDSIKIQYPLLIEYLQIKDDIVVYNSIITLLNSYNTLFTKKIKGDVFIQSFAISLEEFDNLNEYNNTNLFRIGKFDSKSKKILKIYETNLKNNNIKKASNIFLLLSIRGISNYYKIKLSPIPLQINSQWWKLVSLNKINKSGGSGLDSLDALDTEIKGICTAVKDIACLFRHTSKSELIAQGSCLGFDSFNADAGTEIHECLDMEYVDKFIEGRFDDITRDFFNGDVKKMKSEILAWEHEGGFNFTRDHIQFTNSASSKLHMIAIYKTRDYKFNCVNMLISEYIGDFMLAKDVQYWWRTSSSLFSSSSTEVVREVPHEITPSDTKSILMLADIVMGSVTAKARGLPYTYPQVEMCSPNPPPMPPSPSPPSTTTTSPSPGPTPSTTTTTTKAPKTFLVEGVDKEYY